MTADAQTAEPVSPIFVIGTHRSGTTLLGRALGLHPEVAYWEEPRHIWSRGFNFRPDDQLTAEDARPAIRRRIRREMIGFLERSGRSRIAEKTPSNCLRLPFIEQVFPDACYVHIYRDGRAVVHSTDHVTCTESPDPSWYAQRLFGTPIWEWPSLVPRALRTLGRRLLGRSMAYWGPQPPGWRQWLAEDERLVVLAKQWRHTIEPVLSFRKRIGGERWLDIRYEQLVVDPVSHAERLMEFACLEHSATFVDHLVGECHSDRVEAWREHYGQDELARLRPELESVLNRLGYDW